VLQLAAQLPFAQSARSLLACGRVDAFRDPAAHRSAMQSDRIFVERRPVDDVALAASGAGGL